jgi:hypothetical protein
MDDEDDDLSESTKEQDESGILALPMVLTFSRLWGLYELSMEYYVYYPYVAVVV